jgi:hypothetical protein
MIATAAQRTAAGCWPARRSQVRECAPARGYLAANVVRRWLDAQVPIGLEARPTGAAPGIVAIDNFRNAPRTRQATGYVRGEIDDDVDVR